MFVIVIVNSLKSLITTEAFKLGAAPPQGATEGRREAKVLHEVKGTGACRVLKKQEVSCFSVAADLTHLLTQSAVPAAAEAAVHEAN